MSTSDNTPQTPETPETSGVSRRGFLSGAGAAAAGMAAGTLGLDQLAGAAPAEAEIESIDAAALTAGERRRERAMQIRRDGANFWRLQNTPVLGHPTNGDEQRYPNRIGNFSKGMPHNQFGEVNLAAYTAFLKAINSGLAADYNAIPMAAAGARLGNPQAGLAFDSEGVDAQGVSTPIPPALASKELASEMVEHYWQALLRDVNHLDYEGHPVVQAAIADLNKFGTSFKGPKQNGRVTTQTLFRDVAPGTTVGPYISQFYWLNTPFGAEYVERKMWTKQPVDHLQTFDNWLAAQNGRIVESPAFLGERRYIINNRDLSEWVHIDVLFQAYFNACLIMGTPPDNSDIGGGIGVPLSRTNPYASVSNQYPFVTHGGPAIKGLLCEVASRCLKATWHKKWQVHRRLRPEVYAGRVEVTVNQSPGRYNGALHPSLFSSSVLDAIESHNGGTLLLPMAFPEGSPTHPSYTAGHATVAGASVTILKALFDTENAVIPNPVVPTEDGSALVPYTGPDLTVEGELNKCASNVATGRNIAGVHWRSDAFASMRLGQAVAISLLREQKAHYNEPGVRYNFRGFDGERIII
jgi:hypothetical protein